MSVSGKNWEEIKTNNRIVEKVKLDNNISFLASKLAVYNHFDNEELYSINHKLQFNNPFLRNKDFLKGIELLYQSVLNKEKICIIGDYDVDGCISTSLLVKLLKILDSNFFYYIPNRFKDGYGSDFKSISFLIKKKPKLVIFLDNGSNSNKIIDYLKIKKIKSIIIDHHEIYKPYPKSDILINPKKECEYSEFNYFCTANLIYFFIDLLIKKKNINIDFRKNLPLVLLAIISDVMPLRKINRLIALNIIKNFKINNLYLFKKIFEIKKIKKNLEIDDLGYLIAPILNAPGRLDDANQIIELLTANNKEKIDDLIYKAIELNEKRKKIEEDLIKTIDIKKLQKSNKNIIFIKKRFINEGIIGIIAARIKDYLNKPCIVLTYSNNLYKASVRSTEDFNIGLYIKKAIDKKIIIKGGGHNLAAGFSIKENNINQLEDFLNQEFIKNKKVNKSKYLMKISLNSLKKNFYQDFSMLSPFGPKNEKPYFFIQDIKVIKTTIVDNKYISCLIKNDFGKIISAISFNSLNNEISKNLLNNKNKLDLIVRFKENFWNNKNNLQLEIIDLIINSIKA